MAADVPDHQLWSARISSAYRLWKNRAWPLTQQLEDSLSGIFPQCVQGAAVLAPDNTGMWNYANADQVNYNLNLAATQFMLANSWDERPKLSFATTPLGASQELVDGNLKVATVIADDGELTAECRLAMESAMTRGPFVVWYGIGGETPTAQSVASLGIAASMVVEAAMKGEAVTLTPGMDFEAISEAARSLTGDPVRAATLGIQVVGMLTDLAQQADKMFEEEKDSPLKGERAKVWFQATPLGSWCLWDPMVTDWRKAGWMARKIVYDEEEFQACEAFSDKAKREVKPIEVGTSDGWGSVKYASMDSSQAAFENKRFVIWELWDKKHWKVHYIAEGYDGFLEDDDAYPYLDQHGKPVLPRFFPCVVRTPVRSPRERPESSFGIAQLAPGWHMQIEFIKFESKAINAAKTTARLYVAGAGVDEKDFVAVKNAEDGFVVRLKAGGTKEESTFTKLPFDTPAPGDYQSSAMRAMFRFATAVRVPSVAFTGEPVADTLGQEQIALQGSTTTQADITRQYESGYAEACWGALMLFRAYAPPEQVQAYLGVSSTEPRPQTITDSTGQPIMDQQTGQPAVQMLPSLWDEWKMTSLDGHKFDAKFASSTRADEAVKQKMAMDYLVALRGGVTTMGTRLWDEKDTMKHIASAMDQPEPKPYQMSMAEQAAMVMASGGAGAGRKPPGDGKESPNGGREDGRKAGDQRGPAGIPKQQERHRGPPTNGHLSGPIQRSVKPPS